MTVERDINVTITSGDNIEVTLDTGKSITVTFPYSGPVGPAGTSGTSGVDGVNLGSSGTSGSSGSSGSSSTSGTSGSDGSSGTSGFGTSGTSGSSGSSGVGSAGTSGSSGEAGTSGSSGTSGTGISGTSGSSGTSGEKGDAGVAGADGAPGVPGYSPNTLLSGGLVTWVSGYTFRAAAATYTINGATYSSPQTDVTLDAADVTLDRIDVIAVNDSSAVEIIDGTPGATPSRPDVDPATQFMLTFVLVVHDTTTPSEVSSVNVYLEGAGTPSEWAPTVSANFAYDSTSNPQTGTYCIEATNAVTGNNVTLTAGAGVALSSYNNLCFGIRSKASWAAKRSVSIWFANGGVRTGSIVTLRQGSFGFASGTTGAYQQITIPLSTFAVTAATVTELHIQVAGSSTALGFYLDDIVLQGGIAPPVAGAGMTWKRTWNASVTYVANDVVTDGTGAYVAIASSLNDPPSSSPTSWDVIVSGTAGTGGTGSGTSGTSGTSGVGTSGTSGTSSDGTSGTSGVSGTSGTSAAGTDGSSGTSGTSGNGTSGSSGTSGADGTSGTSGSGTSGTSGVNGLPGDAGSSGSSGTSGVGTSGTSGTDGSSGTSGSGTSGTSGIAGSSGSSGTSGDGTSGSSGTSGLGSSGTSGTSGVGTSGSSGTSGSLTGAFGVTIDGAGSVITTGVKGYIAIPFACTISSWYLVAAPAGNLVIDVWKAAGALPTDSDSIAGTELPTLASAAFNSDTNLTTWTGLSVSAGDVIGFNVDSAATVTRATLTIKYTQ